ncbi:hypothetical protein AAFF_G00407770 [Aldrovandia affinis]|uniref:Uncharacterized protein n=1 Tax=Aldrovandia affinis TaxID=143900 RepID=A0AAD7WJY1_9TELE|nr:hypothetical protein AAFF_G00407770 [Aldrovandia affinis]
MQSGNSTPRPPSSSACAFSIWSRPRRRSVRSCSRASFPFSHGLDSQKCARSDGRGVGAELGRAERPQRFLPLTPQTRVTLALRAPRSVNSSAVSASSAPPAAGAGLPQLTTAP